MASAKSPLPPIKAVRSCHFDRLFDERLDKVLLSIFLRLGPADLDSCVAVCRRWRAFVGETVVAGGGDAKARRRLYVDKMTHEWLKGDPKVYKVRET